MSLKLRKRDIIYVVIVFAILSGTMRLTDNGMTSLYRMIGPLVAAVYLCKHFGKFKKELYFVAGLTMYSCMASVLFYKHISYDQLVFVVYIFFEYILIKSMKLEDCNFEANFYKFIDVCTVLTIIAAWAQYFIGYTLPYVSVSRGQPIGVYFSNGNELSEALCCVLVIYVYQVLFCKKKLHILYCASILALTYLNDAKLSLLGGLLAILIMSIYKIRQNKSYTRHISDKLFLSMAIFCAVLFVLVIYVVNPSITTRDYLISLRELLFDAVVGIFKGEELTTGVNAIGSIHDRTSAIIYGMRELKNTYFVGIGIGNSIVMLQKAQYALRSAKSMHNIIFQFLAECGYFAMVVYYFCIKFIVRCYKNISESRINLLKATFLVSFVFLSSQSSVGILSNYYTIMVLIYVMMIDSNFEFKSGKGRKLQGGHRNAI